MIARPKKGSRPRGDQTPIPDAPSFAEVIRRDLSGPGDGRSFDPPYQAWLERHAKAVA